MLQRDKFASAIMISLLGYSYLVSCDIEWSKNLCKIVDVKYCTSVESFYYEKEDTPCLELNKLPPCLINSTSYICDLEVICSKKFLYSVLVDVNIKPLVEIGRAHV